MFAYGAGSLWGPQREAPSSARHAKAPAVHRARRCGADLNPGFSRQASPLINRHSREGLLCRALLGEEGPLAASGAMPLMLTERFHVWPLLTFEPGENQ